VEIWLVRHGQTSWSTTGRHTGWTDIALDADGVRQSEALAGRLHGRQFGLVLVSPLQRALETCRLAGFGQGAEVTDDLREWDYGDYEGRTTPEIRAERPGWSLFADGVPNGESAADVGRRADRVLERARSTEGDTLCVAHGHLLRVLAARWVGLPPAAGRLLALEAGSVSVLGWERDVAVVRRWNEPPPPG
jgi:probable phosphoglycerate mutase